MSAVSWVCLLIRGSSAVLKALAVPGSSNTFFNNTEKLATSAIFMIVVGDCIFTSTTDIDWSSSASENSSSSSVESAQEMKTSFLVFNFLDSFSHAVYGR